MKYRPDVGADTWSLPQETIARRYGDCEDFAFLSENVLRTLGYQPQVIAFKRERRARRHAICIFKKEGRYFYFDNTRLRGTYATSMKQFVKQIDTEDDIAILKADNISDIFQEAINLEGFTKGARVEKKDGIVRITTDL